MWQFKSKTMAAGLLQIIMGICICGGFISPEQAKSIDGLNKPAENKMVDVVGMAVLGGGGLAMKGRSDAQKRIEEKE